MIVGFSRQSSIIGECKLLIIRKFWQLRGVKRFWLYIVVVLTAATAIGARRVDLKLNRRFLDGCDTLQVEARFTGFKSDTITGQVLLQLVSPDDYIVDAVYMAPGEPDPKGKRVTYTATLPMPSNGLDEWADLTKLHETVAIDSAGWLTVEEVPVYLFVDGVEADRKRRKPTIEILNKISPLLVQQVSLQPYFVSSHFPYPGAVYYALAVTTDIDGYYSPDNIYRLQVVANTAGGETVWYEDEISIHTVRYSLPAGWEVPESYLMPVE